MDIFFFSLAAYENAQPGRPPYRSRRPLTFFSQKTLGCEAKNLLFKGQFAEAKRKKINNLWWQRAGRLLTHSIWIKKNNRKKQTASFGCRGRWLWHSTTEQWSQGPRPRHFSLTVTQDISWLEAKKVAVSSLTLLAPNCTLAFPLTKVALICMMTDSME